MILNATEISAEVDSDKIIIDPFDPTQLKAASYVLHLANRWRTWNASAEPVEVWQEQLDSNHLTPIVESPQNLIHHGGFCLAATLERISLPDEMIGFVATLSHLARFGLNVTCGMGVVSPGFGTTTGTSLTLEVTSANPSPIVLRAGLPVCHLILMRISPGELSPPLGHSIYEELETPSGPALAEEWARLCPEQTVGDKGAQE